MTSTSQILESFWNIWSQVSQRKKPFSDFQHVDLAFICCGSILSLVQIFVSFDFGYGNV